MKIFFAMGGYGAYIWSAYAITAVVLGANLLLSGRELSAAIRKIKRRGTQRGTQ